MMSTLHRLVLTVGGARVNVHVLEDEVIEFRLDDAVGDPLASFSVKDLLGREGSCFRCEMNVTSQVGAIYLDGEGRDDCPEAGDAGMPHEIDPPDGWDDEDDNEGVPVGS